jgi:uracil phosphoribosyltransferase
VVGEVLTCSLSSLRGLLAQKVTELRDRSTQLQKFRSTLHSVSLILTSEATRDLPVEEFPIQTPLAETTGYRLRDPVVIIPILRAGLGMAEAMLTLLPDARVGHLGMERNERTHRPSSYYCKLPPDIECSTVFLVDPMLATGHSAADAADELKAHGAKTIRFVGIIGSEPGLKHFSDRHPDIPVFLGAVDPELNENAYIVPGLGDAGDRYFGT